MKEQKSTKQRDKKISRRDFIGSAATAMAFTIVPSHVLGGTGNTPPSEKLNIAGVGFGGMGKNNIEACENENIVAMCDVDWDYAADVFKEYPNAKKYKDYRKMLVCLICIFFLYLCLFKVFPTHLYSLNLFIKF